MTDDKPKGYYDHVNTGSGVRGIKRLMYKQTHHEPEELEFDASEYPHTFSEEADDVPLIFVSDYFSDEQVEKIKAFFEREIDPNGS